MKAISLWPPLAALVQIGCKRWETRGWHTEHRGPLAIHATERFPREARALCERPAYRYALRAVTPPFVRAAIVAIVDVAECVRSDDLLDQLDLGDQRALQLGASAFNGEQLLPQLHFSDFAPGRWAWRLTNLRPLATPIPATGARGLWEWTPPADLDTQLGGVVSIPPPRLRRRRRTASMN